jgi:hypothetical protein
LVTEKHVSSQSKSKNIACTNYEKKYFEQFFKFIKSHAKNLENCFFEQNFKPINYRFKKIQNSKKTRYISLNVSNGENLLIFSEKCIFEQFLIN